MKRLKSHLRVEDISEVAIRPWGLATAGELVAEVVLISDRSQVSPMELRFIVGDRLYRATFTPGMVSDGA